MSDRENDWEAFVTAAAQAAELPLPEECRAQIVGHFTILAGHAARVMAIELDDEVEPAPVFHP